MRWWWSRHWFLWWIWWSSSIRSWRYSCVDKDIKNNVDVNIVDNVYWDVDRVVGAEFGRGFDGWVDSDVGGEVGSGKGDGFES